MSGHHEFKRIVICCDGTWMSSIGEKGAQPPSNVTRIARCLKRKCNDGTPQIILYDPGVGSSASKVDQWLGGAFGMGLEQNIRETYHFICNNYVDGDEIVLIGFSRGAFTARSVADLIGTIGLLKPEGQDHFNEIFNDYENIADTDRDIDKYLTKLDPYVDMDPDAKAEWVAKRKRDYVKFLLDKNYIRGRFRGHEGEPDVKIKAIAVWDTVGTLACGTWKFSDTKISDKVENAFQALALDEPRYAFRPALWERTDNSTTNLKQVWFPGNHGGVGGGWWDQSLSDITLAWMVDQLALLGIEFDHHELTQTFSRTLAYLAAHPFPYVPPQIYIPTKHYVKQHLPLSYWWGLLLKRRASPWASPPIYHPPRGGASATPTRDYNDCPAFQHTHDAPIPDGPATPGRSWALGQLRFPDSFLQCFAGSWVRTPGRTARVDPATNADVEGDYLRNTDERIHSSVRVRLACAGLGWDDREKWTCTALTGNPTNGVRWRLVRERSAAITPSVKSAPNGEIDKCGCTNGESDEKKLYAVGPEDCAWKWVYAEDNDSKKTKTVTKPEVRELPEEPLEGYWERYLLGVNHGGEAGGKGDVWKWALENPPDAAMA